MKSTIINWVNDNKIYLTIIVLAFLIRFYFLSITLSMLGLENLSSATTDSINYLKMADWLMGAKIAYPEGRFFDWGFGHAYWLVSILYIFKSNLAILIIQIILSSISCGLIYKLTIELLNNKTVAIIASLLLVFSATSINISILILSDTLYFFLMLLGLYYYIIGIRKNQWKYFMLAGCFTGCGVLVRSIGQFWIVPMMVIIGLYMVLNSQKFNLKTIYQSHKAVFIKCISMVCLIIVLMSTMVIRNYNKYEIPTMAFTSAGGPANVAAWTVERLTGTGFREVKKEWYAEYKEKMNLDNLTLGNQYILLRENAIRVFQEHPTEYINVYFSNVWANITALNYLPRITFPLLKQYSISFENLFLNYNLQYLNFLLSILGLFILFFTKRYYAGFILLMIYTYYGILMGSSLWQGSRLFYPGQMAAVILMAVTLYTIFRWAKKVTAKNLK